MTRGSWPGIVICALLALVASRFPVFDKLRKLDPYWYLIHRPSLKARMYLQARKKRREASK